MSRTKTTAIGARKQGILDIGILHSSTLYEEAFCPMIVLRITPVNVAKLAMFRTAFP